MIIQMLGEHEIGRVSMGHVLCRANPALKCSRQTLNSRKQEEKPANAAKLAAAERRANVLQLARGIRNCVSSRELMEEGVSITVPNAPGDALVIYDRVTGPR